MHSLLKFAMLAGFVRAVPAPSSSQSGSESKSGPGGSSTTTAVINFEEYGPLGLTQAGLTAQGICVNNINPLGPVSQDLLVSGIKPHGKRFAAFDFIRGSTIEPGHKEITVNPERCNGAVTDKFSLTSICFACLASTQVPLEGVPLACNLTLTEYKVQGRSTEEVQVSNAGSFTFTPNALLSDLKCVKVNGLKDVTSVRVEVNNGVTTDILAGLIDDVGVEYTRSK